MSAAEKFMLWMLCFTPTLTFAYPPPADLAMRCIVAASVLVGVGAFLGVFQPWNTDGEVRP